MSDKVSGQAANRIVALVMEHGLKGQRPPNWAKQHVAARRMLKNGITEDQVVRACRGMKKVPGYQGGIFDCFDLERHIAKALAAAPAERAPPKCDVCGSEDVVARIDKRPLCRKCFDDW